MKVIIPAAGIGKRLRPHTLMLPKPLLPIGDSTIIDYLLRPLEALAPDELITVIGYKGEMLREHVESNYRFRSTWVHQNQLLGLGYALHIAMAHVEPDDSVLIILADTVVETDLRAFIQAGDNSLGLRQVDDPTRFGIAEITNGLVSGLEEKPASPRTNLALIGLYFFRRAGALKEALARLVESGKTTSGEIQLTDALADMIGQGIPFTPFEVAGWYDCGKKETVLATNRHLLERLVSPPETDGITIHAPVYIGRGVQLERCTIGPNVSLFDGASIRGAEVRESIVGRGATIVDSQITDSIIGDEANIRSYAGSLSVGHSAEVDGRR